MTKAEWEANHHYRKSEHTCSWCKYHEAIVVDPWIERIYWTKKLEARAGESTKASFDCDLWEHQLG
jgi:hypothetical protein